MAFPARKVFGTFEKRAPKNQQNRLTYMYRVEMSPESTGNQIKAKGVLSEMAGRRSQFANGTSLVMRAVSGRTNHVREGRLVW